MNPLDFPLKCPVCGSEMAKENFYCSIKCYDSIRVEDIIHVK